MLIGITGKKRSGKDAVAAELIAATGSMCRIAYGDALKRVAMDLYSLSYRQCFGDTADKETVDPRWGLSAREILQRLGTEVGRSVHADTWIRKMLYDAQALQTAGLVWEWENSVRWARHRYAHLINTRHIVVPDVRFPNEGDAIRTAGGIVIRVDRDFATGAFEDHASETSVDAVEYDWRIGNNGTLDGLKHDVRQLVSRVGL
jgi:deoxynucleotide monophosphate kinase-like protein